MDVFHLLLSKIDGTNVVGGFQKFSLINTYNREIDGENPVSSTGLFTSYQHPTLIVEDLKVHNLYSYPEREISGSNRRSGEQYFRVAGLHKYAILNELGVYTRTSDIPTQRPSVINYTLANRPLGNHTGIKHWKTNIAHTGSNHNSIRFVPTRSILMEL